MKQTVQITAAAVALSTLLVITGCDNGGSSGGGSNVNCDTIAGSYSSSFQDQSCSDGKSYKGSITVRIFDDCSVQTINCDGAATSGQFTTMSGYSYLAEISSPTCGEGDMKCTVDNDSLGCDYSFDKGGGGRIY
ncbi:MAG: hypothetical protein ABFS19_02545 [Thermodesulfobacteriota bacterium]